MIKLHTHSLALNGIKAHLLLEESGHPYELVEVDLTRRAELGASTLSRNPLGRVPFIDDDGFILAESGSILRYLAQKWRLLDWYPSEPHLHARIDEWLDFAGIHLNPSITTIYLARWFVRQSDVNGWGIDLHVLRSALSHLARDLPIFDGSLAEREFAADDRPTIADLALLPFIAVAPGVGVSLEPYPAIRRWRAQMLARPSWARVADPRLPVIAPPSAATCDVGGPMGMTG